MPRCQTMTPEPRRVGRPHEFDVMLTVRVTTGLFDELSLEAIRREIRLSDVIRERLGKAHSRSGPS